MSDFAATQTPGGTLIVIKGHHLIVPDEFADQVVEALHARKARGDVASHFSRRGETAVNYGDV